MTTDPKSARKNEFRHRREDDAVGAYHIHSRLASHAERDVRGPQEGGSPFPAPSAASGLASQAEELCNVCEYPVSDPRCVHWGPYSKSEGLADEIEKILAEYHRAVELDEASLLPNIMSRWCDLFFKPGATAILAALRSHQAPVGEERDSVIEKCARIAEAHEGTAAKEISATRWKQMDEETREQVRAEQRGEDIASALIATAIRALKTPSPQTGEKS